MALAALYLLRYNDKFYGQWVLMNVPFRSLDELKRPELELVPDHFYYQAMALLLRPEHWKDPAKIRAELELEAFREYHVKNILAMVVANQLLIEKYLDGALDKNQEIPEEVAPAAAEGGEPPLALEQQRICDEIVESVRQGSWQRLRQEDAWKGEAPGEEDGAPFAAAAPRRPALAVLGPAGSGKTTAAHAAIRQAVDHGRRVLLTAPTGRLAASMREKFPDLEVDTVHGAFLVYKPAHETLEVMLPYDLVAIEEVGQLSRPVFERIME